jgi:hypothetical protein
MSHPLTLETLLKRGACADQRQRFADTFGKSVDVTPELCMSVADQFTWAWAARCLLSPEAQAEYKRVCAPAQADRVCYSAWAEYKRVCDSAWAEYERVRDSALAEHKRVCAREFGRLYANGGAA